MVAKRPKYGNRITEVDGIAFDSRAEARRYGELKLLERGGAIGGLRVQVPYPVVVNGIRICKYIADFVYVEAGAEIVEDVKGYRTAVYRLKKRLVEACYGLKVKET